MRLIDADEMIKRLQGWNTNDTMDKALYNFTMQRILEQPIIKSEIIRCKDCKYYTPIRKHSMNLKIGVCSLSSWYMGDDSFCSEAERREDERSD